jgi:hypothetical protein
MSSRTYSIPTTLRMVPNDLLRQFFEELGYARLDIPWDELGQRDPKPILAALKTLPDVDLSLVDAELRTIHTLACDTGMVAIREAGEVFEVDPFAGTPGAATPYHRAAAAWLAHREVVRHAVRIHRVDTLSWWRRRDDLPRYRPEPTPELCGRLARALSKFFLDEDNRGRECTVETLSLRGVDYYFAHPDDFLQPFTTHDENGELTTRPLRPTFQIVFAFNARAGTLDLNARVPAKLRPQIESVFATALFGHGLPKWSKRPSYALGQLRDPNFSLEADPQDGVRVELLQMRLEFRNSRRQIILKADPQRPNDIRHLIDDAINQDRVKLSDLNLTLVTLGFWFADGEEPAELTIDVSVPSHCNLREVPPNRLDVVCKYLRRWGIDGAGPPEAAVA